MQYNTAKQRRYWYVPVLVITGLVVFYSACKKTDSGGLSSTVTIMPTSGPAGNLVRITGSGFDVDITHDSVSFNGVSATIVNSSPTQLQVQVPIGVTTGPVTVWVNGRKATGPVYTVSSVSVSSLSPSAGLTGDSVAISGLGMSNLGSLSELAGPPVVKFNGKAAKVVSATPTKLMVLVPDKAGAGPVTVSIGGETSTGPVFNYLGLDTVYPVTGNVGTIVTINGQFGPNPGQDTVTVNGVKAVVDSVSATRLIVTVPAGAKTGNVVVRAGGRLIQGPVFSFVAGPAVTAIAPASGPAGIKVTITGTGFSTIAKEDSVSFNNSPATILSVSATQLIVAAPTGVTSGPVVVVVNNQAVNGPVFTAQGLGVSSINPVNFVSPAMDTITGIGFSATASQNVVQFNGQMATVVSASDTQLVVQVPAGTTSGAVSVQVGGLSASGGTFSTAGVSTLAGFGRHRGLTNGQGAQAQFSLPLGLAVDAAGDVFVADQGGNNIREISPYGVVTNFAGDPNGGSGFTDGQGAAAQFNGPMDMVIDASGNLYVADNGNLVVRKILPDGTVSTFTTLPSGNPPGGVALDGAGNIYVTDNASNNVYEYDVTATLINTFNVPTAVQLFGVAVDAAGNVYTSDQQTGTIYEGANAVVLTGIRFTQMGLSFDNNGRLIMAAQSAYQVYRIDPAANFKVTTITGGAGVKGVGGYKDGPLGVALFGGPVGVKVDALGVIYVADSYGYAIRKISLK